MVCPADDPLIVNPAPLTVAWETVTAAVPEFDKLIEAVALPPTTTPLKLTAVGDAANPGCVPSPASAIVIGEFDALLEIEILPLALPTAVGENCAVKLMLCPG